MPRVHNNKIIGLTGMSGAGKTTAREFFSQNGFCIIDCDSAARKTAADPRFLSELAERFDEDIFDENGALDRKKTASIIFSDKEKNRRYLSIIFPYITYEILREITLSDRDVLLDAPTLFEARLEGLCDKIISITAEREICIRRISLRDKISPEQAQARLNSQHSAEFFKKNSDHVIENNKDFAELRRQLEEIYSLW